VAEHVPLHSPLQLAEPPVTTHVPLHVPLQLAPPLTVQEPVHMPEHWPPEKLPVHAAEHDPDAFALQVPAHVPAQAALVTLLVPLLILHVPVQLPPHEPEKLALQPASHVPDHVGAVH
jgi:hypothetical protein